MMTGSRRLRMIQGGLAIATFGAYAVGAAPVAAAADDAAAKAAYKTKCVACHAADGSGQNATGKSLKVPDLRSEEVQKRSDAGLANIIAEGKNNMPSFKGGSSETEIKNLVAYIRELGAKKAAAK